MKLRNLIENSLSSVIVPAVKIVLTFIMSPLIVRALGNYDYGILEMVFAVVGYMGILDLGLMPAIVRYVARHQALEDRAELNKIYSSAMAFLFPVGLAMALVLLAIALWAPHLILKGAVAGEHQKYFIFLLLVAAQTFVTFTGSLFDCFLEGFQQYKIRNYATVFMSIAGALVMYPLLKSGGGLITVAVVNTAGYAIKFAFYGIMVGTRRYGGFRFRFADTSYATLKGMFSFGFKSLIYAISLRISTVTDSLVIGAFLGPAVVTLYIIPYNFVAQLRTFVWALSRNFMPLFSELDALGEKAYARSIYFGASRFMVGMILPFIIGIVILGPSFLEYWMGPEYAQSGRVVLYIIAAASTMQWFNPFSNRLLTGYNQHGIMARLGVISSLINLSLSLILVQFLGKEGVALGTLLPTLVFEPLLLYKTCKVLEVSAGYYLRQVLVPVIFPVIVITAALWIMLRYYSPESLLQVIFIATAGMLLYLPAFFRFSLSSDERRLVLSKIGLQPAVLS